jgi:hypothetical protein
MPKCIECNYYVLCLANVPLQPPSVCAEFNNEDPETFKQGLSRNKLREMFVRGRLCM